MASATYEEGTMNFDDATLRAIAEVYSDEGNKEYAEGEFSSALDQYTEGIKVKCKDDELNAKLYIRRALAHKNLGNVQESLDDVKAAFELQPSFKEAIKEDVVLLEEFDELHRLCQSRATSAFNSQIFREARELFELCLKIAEDMGKRIQEGVAYANIGTCDFGTGDYKNAIESYELCLKFITELNDRAFKAQMHTNLGDAHYSIKNFREAIDNYSICLQIFEEMGDIAKKGAMYGYLAQAYHKIGDNKMAIHYQELRLKTSIEIGDRETERSAYCQLGLAYFKSENYEMAIKYCELYLTILPKSTMLFEEGQVYSVLGTSCRETSDFRRALICQQRCLRIMTQYGDKKGQCIAYCNLGHAYGDLGDLEESLNCYKQHLRFAKENGDRFEEGRAFGNIGHAQVRLGNFKEAIEYFELCLEIAKETGNKLREVFAFTGLGLAHDNLGHYETAMEFFKLQLQIAKDLGAKKQEASAYCNLGNTCRNTGDFKQALDYHTRLLNIAKESRDKYNEGVAYGCLGNDYYKVGHLKEAIENHERHLKMCKELGDREGEGRAYGNLGNDYRSLGNLPKAKHCYELNLKIAQVAKARALEGGVYANLGIVYRLMKDSDKAIENHSIHLEISKEVGDRPGQGRAYGNLGLAYQDRGDFEKALEYHNLCLEVAKEIGDKATEGNAYGNIGSTYKALGDDEKALHYHECQRKSALEVGDEIGQAIASFHVGLDSESMGSLCEALHCFESSVRILNDARTRLQSNDEWKIGLRDLYKHVYVSLCRVLINQDKIVEGLLAAEQGRAQALRDLMESNYGFEMANVGFPMQKVFIDDTLGRISSNIAFTAIDKKVAFHWVCQKEKIRLRKVSVVCDVHSLLEVAREKIGVTNGPNCEDRSLDSLRNIVEFEDVGIGERRVEKHSDESQSQDNPLRTLYDLTISPISDLLDGDELIVVPDGPLWLAPYAAFMDSNSRYLSESFRIRFIPSLFSLKLILDSTNYHAKNDALLVGDPWMQDVKDSKGKPLLPKLPWAKKEVEMIGQILHTIPLTGKEATKDEVLKRISKVALVHIAAHGRMETGEIALSPNPNRVSQKPRDEDFLLSISDVLNIRLGARLVVLSCCHSGRGEIKAEGVVGIARAFLGAGARSVLVSLWAIDDEATLEFMKYFYQHLTEGKSASKSLNQAMKIMRESDKFSEVKYWAPFVLIGDDVTLEFPVNH